MSLPDSISQALGVVAVPVSPSVTPMRWARHSSWAPARPEAVYEYGVNVTRREYGVAYIRCAEDENPIDCIDDIEWEDCDAVEVQSVIRISNTPINEKALNAWDAEFGDCYDTNGQPVCTGCRHRVGDATVLTKAGASWYCQECWPDYQPDVEP